MVTSLARRTGPDGNIRQMMTRWLHIYLFSFESLVFRFCEALFADPSRKVEPEQDGQALSVMIVVLPSLLALVDT